MKHLIHVLMLVSLFAALIAPANVRAQEGQPADPSANEPPQIGEPIPVKSTRYKTLAGVDFHPNRSDQTYSTTNGGIYPLNLFPYAHFSAPLNLPRGAVITQLEFFFVDNSSTNIRFSLVESDPQAPTPNATSHFISDTAAFSQSSAIRTLVVPGAGLTVNNQRAYNIWVRFADIGGSQALYGVRVTYTLPLLIVIADEYLTLAGAAFYPARSDITYQTTDQHIFATSSPYTQALFLARIDLPNGAQVDQIEYFLIDNADEAIGVYAIEKDPAQPMETLGMKDTTGMPKNTSVQKVTLAGSPSFFTADNAYQSYLLGVSFGAYSLNQRLVGVKVRYKQGSPSSGMLIKTFAGLDFKPTGSSLTYMNLNGGIYATSLSAGRSFQVNLDLPDGVVVYRVTFYVTDISIAQHLVLGGRTYIPQAGAFANPFLANTQSLQPSDQIRALSYTWPAASKSVFDTYKHNYRLRVELPEIGEDLILHGARVEYFFPKFVFLPVITR